MSIAMMRFYFAAGGILLMFTGGTYLIKHKLNIGNVSGSKGIVLPSLNNTNVSATTILVDYTNNGFVPNKISLKKGQTVIITNTSSRDFQPVSSSDQAKEILNSTSPIHSGDSYKYTFDKVGIWGYRDSLSSDHVCTIIVE